MSVGGDTLGELGLEHRFAWAEKVGASLLAIVLGATLSNLGLVPVGSPVYDAVFGPVTSLAIVWLLQAVDLRDLRAAGPRMLGAFALALAIARRRTDLALPGLLVGLLGYAVGDYLGLAMAYAVRWW